VNRKRYPRVRAALVRRLLIGSAWLAFLLLDVQATSAAEPVATAPTATAGTTPDCSESVVFRVCPGSQGFQIPSRMLADSDGSPPPVGPLQRKSTRNARVDAQRAKLDQAQARLRAQIEYDTAHPYEMTVWGAPERNDAGPQIEKFGEVVQASKPVSCKDGYLFGAKAHLDVYAFARDLVEGKPCQW
jgi:hypothetical protein